MKSRLISSLKLLLLIGAIFIFLDKKVLALNQQDCYLYNNNGICINKIQYNNLINLGFTDFEIKNINIEEFNKNKELSGKVVSQVINYYQDDYYIDNGIIKTKETKITKEQYDSYYKNNNAFSLKSLTPGYIETNMKKMSTTIISINNVYRYKITLEWKSNPSVRSYDIIGIGMENNKVYYAGNRTFNQTYCTSSNSCKNSSAGIFKNQETGIAVAFDLPSGTFSQLSSYLYFDVGKKIGTVTSMKAYGDYAHAIETTTSTEANSYNINGSGINLFLGVINKYDTITTSVAEWTGNW